LAQRLPLAAGLGSYYDVCQLQKLLRIPGHEYPNSDPMELIAPWLTLNSDMKMNMYSSAGFTTNRLVLLNN
jgi:hypothetical protein